MVTAILEIIGGFALISVLAPLLIQKFFDVLTTIGINTEYIATYTEFYQEFNNIVETLANLPGQVIGIIAANVYNLIPNLSAVFIIMFLIVLIIAFKVVGLIMKGT